MSIYRLDNEIEKLEAEMDEINAMPLEEFRHTYSADTKEEIFDIITDDLKRLQEQLEIEKAEEDEENYYRTVDVGFADEADYCRYKYGYYH